MVRPCRSCGTHLEHSFCDLGMSPLSNAFIKPDAVHAAEVFYPLHAYVCHRCFLVQLEEFKSPEHLFEDYAYFSSYSDTWLHQCEQFVGVASERFAIDAGKQVIEIASNDGYLLQYFRERSVPVLGIEPAANVAAAAEARGIRTLLKFFGTRTADELVAEGIQADVLIANNVLAHVPDLNDFVAGMKILLRDVGVICVEFPHLLRLMQETQFDTIYHEHFSYFSLLAAKRVFERHMLVPFDVEELPTHGGSLRVYCCHAAEAPARATGKIESLLAREYEAKLDQADTYASFAEQVRETKRKLLTFLIAAKRDGRTIAGYGAPAKGNTLFNYCGIRSDFVDFTVDRNPHKQGLLLPGSRIPICPPEVIRDKRPDYLLILPWNLRDEIIGQMSCIRDWGGRFVVPIPEVSVLP